MKYISPFYVAKKSVILIVLLVLCNLTLKAQIAPCNSDTITFYNVTCLGAATPGTDDDFLMFSVTSNSTNSNYITLPPGSTPVTGQYGIFGPGPYNFTVPSPNCGPVVIPTDVLSCQGSVTLQVLAAPIPTIGQWSIFIILIVMTITGLVVLRSKRTALSLNEDQR
ncbi:MAG: hypothetical protein KDC49_04405 [Saprospiraceae bacterium]|nr:hypothetical protein [Saprospiraceae bacterium]